MTNHSAELLDLFAAHPELGALQQRVTAADAQTRRIALIEIADEADEDHLPILIAATADEAPLVRAEAARLLAGWETAPVLSALINLLSDLDHEVRTTTAQKLSELKTRAAGLQLLPLALHDNTFVKTAALRALRELRVAEAAPAALEALRNADAGVRREAVGVLGWLKQIDALPQLATLANNDPNIDVRRASTSALGLATEPAAATLLDTLVLPSLLRALQDDVWTVREEAAATLGKLQLHNAAPNLIAALRDEYWQVRLRAARALGRIRSIAAVGALIETLQYTLSNVRKEAAIALGEIGDVSAGPALTEASNDADPDVRKSARLALTQLGLPTSHP
ncbi:MAG: lyase [Verrucomicrobiaceae bacterium]|nr:lyase [Verrucomicrobiaceae bacterium]